MKQKLRLFAIHQTTIRLQRTDNLNLRTRWYPALDESNRMKSAYFKIHPGKKSSSSKWLPVEISFFLSTGFTSSTFPIQPDFSQNQLAAITLNTGSPQTLTKTWVQLVAFQVPKFVPFQLTFSSHWLWGLHVWFSMTFFHHVRKWRLRMWNFTIVYSSNKGWGGVIENGSIYSNEVGRGRGIRVGFQVLSPEPLEVYMSNLNHWQHGSWDLPLHTKVPSPKYDMDAYMATSFGGEYWDLCWDSQIQASKLTGLVFGPTQLSTKSREFFRIK
jgi:hypothetical protein